MIEITRRGRPALLGRLLRAWVPALFLALTSCAKDPTQLQLELHRTLERASGGRAPIVIIPGALGSALRKRDPSDPTKPTIAVWGGLNPLLGHVFDEMELATDSILGEGDVVTQPDRTGEIFATRIVGEVKLPWYMDLARAALGLADKEYFVLTEQLLKLGYQPSGLRFADAFSPTVVGDVCPGDNLFLFYYDWRRDIAALAARLDLYLATVVQATKLTASRTGVHVACSSGPAGEIDCRTGPALGSCPPIEIHRPSAFDPASWNGRVHVVAHSLGGLVATYYAAFGGRPLPHGDLPAFDPGAMARIQTLFLVGTPSRGSLHLALRYDEFPFNLTLDPVLSRRVLATLPATYQLMPFGDADIVGAGDGPLVRADQLYETRTWRRLRWGIYHPEFRDPDLAPWERFLDAALNRARRVHQALLKAEDELRAQDLLRRTYVIGGDCVPTIEAAFWDGSRVHFLKYDDVAQGAEMPRFAADFRSRVPGWDDSLLTAVFAPGDGRVTLRSQLSFGVSGAARGGRSNPPFFHCAHHARLYQDVGVQDFILTVLHRWKDHSSNP